MRNSDPLHSKVRSAKTDHGTNDVETEVPCAATVRSPDGLISTTPPMELAILVGVSWLAHPDLLSLEDSLAELALLARTAGVEVVDTISQRLQSPNSSTLIGTGKLEELQTLVLERGANLVIFDDELSPRQQRELESVLGQDVKILDRDRIDPRYFCPPRAHT